MKLDWAVAAGILVIAGSARGQDIKPPTLHFAPDRTYHLIHAATFFDVDDQKQRAIATVVDTFAMLRDGTTQVEFDTSGEKVDSVEIDGKSAPFTFNKSIHITVPLSPAGTIHTLRAKVEGSFFHWLKPTNDEPSKVGFYAEGLSASPVAWSYPNDFSTTELHITLPAAWGVYSNGLFTSDRSEAKGRHTVVWKMDQLHANYLNSIVAGPFASRRDSWRGIPILLSCPKGLEDRLDYTFANTKDILDYFSQKLDFKYPWAKYGQNLTYDHPYGEANVSATIYPVYWGQRPFLTNARDGMHPTEDVIAHETAHQWFGDLITCKNWGDTWLNEGFATFMEMMYTLHSRGQLESLRELESYSQGYFRDSRRDFRPVATNLYSDSLGMGGWTTYYKGAAVLMSLRSQLGDENFFRGLRHYVAKRRLSNTESNDLCEDLSDATGVNLHAWFDQWIYKPGHPVIDWSWSFDARNHSVLVHVKQTQDTPRGVPIYDVPTHVAVITAAGLQRYPIRLNVADQTFELPVAAVPDTVLFDPDHDFLRQIPTQPWKTEEWPTILQQAPNPTDRAYALSHLLDGTPSAATLRMIAAVLSRDKGPYPAITDTGKLAALKRPELNDFWVSEAHHPNFDRRTHAATGLAGISAGPADVTLLRSLLKEDQPYTVVAAALRGLAEIDFPSVQAQVTEWAENSKSQDIRHAAIEIMVAKKASGWEQAVLDTAAEGRSTFIRKIGIDALVNVPKKDSHFFPVLRNSLVTGEDSVVSAGIRVTVALNLREMIPDLERLKARNVHVAEVTSALTKLNTPSP